MRNFIAKFVRILGICMEFAIINESVPEVLSSLSGHFIVECYRRCLFSQRIAYDVVHDRNLIDVQTKQFLYGITVH